MFYGHFSTFLVAYTVFGLFIPIILCRFLYLSCVHNLHMYEKNVQFLFFSFWNSSVSCMSLCNNNNNTDENYNKRNNKLYSTSAPASTNCLLGNFEVPELYITLLRIIVLPSVFFLLMDCNCLSYSDHD